MTLGPITISDIVSVLTLIFGGLVLYKVFRKNSNKVSDNEAGGDIAGGDIINSNSEHKSSYKTKNKNKVVKNHAKGDIAGGNIYKK